MAARKVLVTAKDALPEKKISVNKDWMAEWLDKFGTLEDVEWYEKTCAENQTTMISNLDNQTYTIPDWAKVRAAFLKRFFPWSYAKKPAAKKQQIKYEDKLAAIKARKQMEKDQVKMEYVVETPKSRSKK